MTRGEVTYVAASEDDPVVWLAHTATRWEARCQAAADWQLGAGHLIAPWRVKVTPDCMRKATRADCPVHGVALRLATPADCPVHQGGIGAGLGDPPWTSGCECHRVEDDPYYLECELEHPEAIVLWRCEPRIPPLWWCRLRRWQRRVGANRRRPVLWGGRVGRESTWLDRVLFGGGSCGWIAGDRWFCVGESELRYCVVCAAVTPHVGGHDGRLMAGGAGGRCQSVRHHRVLR